jgi:hypothetical protein
MDIGLPIRRIEIEPVEEPALPTADPAEKPDAPAVPVRPSSATPRKR